jgi:thiamine-monophosphate kinase
MIISRSFDPDSNSPPPKGWHGLALTEKTPTRETNFHPAEPHQHTARPGQAVAVRARCLNVNATRHGLPRSPVMSSRLMPSKTTLVANAYSPIRQTVPPVAMLGPPLAAMTRTYHFYYYTRAAASNQGDAPPILDYNQAMTTGRKSEDHLIAWIARRFAAATPTDARDATRVGIGDDMAILNAGGETILIAADMLLDGVHFDTQRHTPQQIGRKALAVNLSDCAAMAARPWCAVVSIALPRDWSMEQAQGLMEGVAALAEEFDCAIVGGDTNSWDKPLAIDVTILARPYDGIAPVTRAAAQVGDAVCVTGTLGGSLSGKHLDFTPRVAEARQLAETLGPDLHAMMDLSDGLSTDAARMARASNVGIELDRAALLAAASDAVRTQSADYDERLRHVVGDGEDFELLFAVAPNRAATPIIAATVRKRLAHDRTETPIARIGTIVTEPGVWLIDKDNRRTSLAPTGWQHFK